MGTRLRHASGAIVEVSEEKAARLGWPSADPAPAPTPDKVETPDTEKSDPAGEASEKVGPPSGNASRKVWAEYAASLGINVPDDAKQSDIKALVATDLGN